MTRRQKSRHILLIGGMGPQASLYAHALLVKNAALHGASNNEDYPRVTHLSINVKDFISNPSYREGAKEYILTCLNEINLATVDGAVITCNTAHVLKDSIEQHTGLKITSLIDTTVESMSGNNMIKTVGIIATPTSLNNDLYAEVLSDRFKIIQPDLFVVQKIEHIIREVITGGDESALAIRLQAEIDSLVEKGADRVIL